MAVSFSCTLRALEAEQPGRRGPVLLLLGPPALWGAWAVLAPVPLWEVTETARLEVASATHPLTAVVGGRVMERRLSLGQEVKSGEAVVFLDAESERRALKEKQARRQALEQQLAALRREIQVATAALAAFREARDVALEESKAHAAEAQARAEFAGRQAEMTRRLWTKRAGTLEEYRRDTAEAEARRSASSGLRLAVERVQKDRTVEEAERRARLARLESEAKKLEGESAVEAAGIHRLEHDMTCSSSAHRLTGGSVSSASSASGPWCARGRSSARSCPPERRMPSPCFRLPPWAESAPASRPGCDWTATHGRNGARSRPRSPRSATSRSRAASASS
jgi:multidrug efflux pump subunit AcrA (membrane-fusion protein)